MVYKLIIFDLDNTIVIPPIPRRIISTLGRYSLAERLATSSVSLVGLIPCAGPMLKRSALQTIEALTALTGEYKPFKDVVNFIKYTDGYKMAVLSSNSKQFVHEQLEKYGISERFIAIVTGEDVSILKPDPEGLIKILKMSEVKRDETIYFGSDFIDCLTGENAHIVTVSSLDDLKMTLYKDRLFFTS
jgi:HAD superfamily hydrolase (TIGR01549 family)